MKQQQWSVVSAVLSLGLILFTACTSELGERAASGQDAGILHGQDLEANDPLAKSVVLLFNVETTDVCTASILNNQFALTAAHCVEDAKPEDLRLIFDNVQRDRSPSRPVVEKATSKIYKSNRTKKTNTGDIALVRFAGGVPRGYEAAKFLPEISLLTKGTSVTAVGYGVDETLATNSAGTLRTASVKILDPDFSETEMTLNQKSKIGVCHGDSGGPIYLIIDGHHYLWGVVSRSVDVDHCADAAIVTNALVYVNWIRDTIIEMGRRKISVPDKMRTND